MVDFSKVFKWNHINADANANDDSHPGDDVYIETSQKSCTPVDTSNNSQENLTDSILIVSNKTKELTAKLTELEQWKAMGVYREVEDEGQDCISLRLVIKDKLDVEAVKLCKARLCVRGFEEEQDFRTDSPTCSREGIRLFLAATASKKWKIHSMDVKGAFLQGKELERKVVIRPPREAETSKLWMLQK